MESKLTTRICRLCLETSDDIVNIFENFQDSSEVLTIASILTKHLGFQVDETEGLSECICQICWHQTKSFHNFYKKVELLQKCYWDSVEIASVQPIERSDSPKNAIEDPDLNIVKCEETELTFQTNDTQISNDSLDYSDDQNETEQISDYKEQTSTEKPSFRYSKENREKQNKEIRLLFTMKCDICSNVEFEDLSEARRHYRSVHQMKGYLVCCGKKFFLRGEIVPHIRYHNKPEARLKREKQNARIRELFTMRCDICSDFTFEDLLGARNHYRSVHNIRGYLICCEKKFWARRLISLHILTHVAEYRCDQCSPVRFFRSKSNFQQHVDNHSPLDSRPYKCSSCTSTFSRGYLLKAHVRDTHDSKTGEKFPCDHCDKNFRSKLLLSHHVKYIHELDSLDHVCEICANRFRMKAQLNAHMLCQHSTQPKVQCNICGAWLKHKNSIQRHVKLMHQEGNSVACPICNKMVKNKHVLGNHIRYAHGERSHKCTLCDKKFKTALTLKEHVACHTGEYLYNCQYCEKKFKSSANLFSHRKKMHLAELTRDFPKHRAYNKKSTNEKTESKSNTIEASSVS